jgi:preprotein translocase subunit YajC
MEFLSPEIMQWAPFVIMIVIFYFLFYRPQKNEQKKRADMLGNLKKGDRVVTIGGLHGTIIAFSDDTVTIKVAEKVELDFNRSAVASVKTKAE